jgi:signal transduction histidine kinase
MPRWLQRLLRGWFDLPLLSKGRIVISIPLICILFSVAALAIFQRQRGHLDEWIARAFHAGSGIQAVITLLVDAESGTRGFLLTHDPKYLEPFHKAEVELPRSISQLKDSIGDIPSQRKRLAHIDRLAQETLAALAASLSAPGGSGVADRLAHARALSQSIGQESAAMRAEETSLWFTRIQAEKRLRERLSISTYGVAILSLLASSVAMGLFLTGIVRRAQLLRENADRLVHREALLDLPPGVDEIGQVGAALARSSHLLLERESELRKLNQELDLRVTERTAELERAIAEHGKSEEQLRQALKMEAIGRLAGGIAHDFNNVLTVVLGFGETLGEKLTADSSAKEDLDEILQAANHAASLTRQLLAFSRRQVIRPTVLDLNAIVARTEKLLRHVIGEDVELRTHYRATDEGILIDEGQLEQVIMNLVVNARDAMPTGGRLTIETDVIDLDEGYCGGHFDAVPGRHAMLAVSDSGHGMTPEVQARIFEPFFTTKESGKGTGLGLSTVYGIVKQSHGSIWVYSEPGLGSTFKLYFPVARRTEEPVPHLPPPDLRVKGSPTVLLVEDEAGVRRMAKQVLVNCGYVVLEADGADSARRACLEHLGKIDLLLTDVIMPKTNGRELAEELEIQYPSMRVLYMSGYTGDIITQHAVLKPGIALIEKPFTPLGLATRIREVMGSS